MKLEKISEFGSKITIGDFKKDILDVFKELNNIDVDFTKIDDESSHLKFVLKMESIKKKYRFAFNFTEDDFNFLYEDEKTYRRRLIYYIVCCQIKNLEYIADRLEISADSEELTNK